MLNILTALFVTHGQLLTKLNKHAKAMLDLLHEWHQQEHVRELCMHLAQKGPKTISREDFETYFEFDEARLFHEHVAENVYKIKRW